MSWDGTYANGANGACHACGAETAEDYHVLCPPCFAEDQGWTKPKPETSHVVDECDECGDVRVLYPSDEDDDRRLCLDCRWPA